MHDEMRQGSLSLYSVNQFTALMYMMAPKVHATQDRQLQCISAYWASSVQCNTVGGQGGQATSLNTKDQMKVMWKAST